MIDQPASIYVELVGVVTCDCASVEVGYKLRRIVVFVGLNPFSQVVDINFNDVVEFEMAERPYHPGLG